MAHKKEYKKVPVPLAQAILDYLTTKPFREVHQLIDGLLQSENTTQIIAGDAPEAPPESDTPPEAETPPTTPPAPALVPVDPQPAAPVSKAPHPESQPA